MRRINRDSRTGETDHLSKSEAAEWYEDQAYGLLEPSPVMLAPDRSLDNALDAIATVNGAFTMGSSAIDGSVL